MMMYVCMYVCMYDKSVCIEKFKTFSVSILLYIIIIVTLTGESNIHFNIMVGK